MTVMVHKAVEPKNLSKAGKALYEAILVGDALALILEKMDGVYTQIVNVNGHWLAFSRTGEPMPSIGQDILSAFKGADPARRYIGEAWMPGLTHAELNGRARRQSPQHLQVWLTDSYRADMPEEVFTQRLWHADLIHSPGGYVKAARRYRFEEIVALPGVDNIEEELYAQARVMKRSTRGAFDGLILRQSMGLFKEGAGKDGEIIKIKPRLSGDFRVVGVVEGKGKAEGMAGALILALGGGVTCEVGTGLDDNTRKDYWAWWQGVLKDGRGPRTERIAEVEYLAVTKDGKLREPSFKATRWDKNIADVIPGNIKGGE